MITLRLAEDRGHADFGWLDSRHTFSFGQYLDPDNMGFGPLRVINDDRVAPGHGFDTHGHRDMEIVSYVLEGALEHKDSTGAGSVIRPGEVQCISAGTGIRHSEYNPSQSEPVHFLQIWVLPERAGLAPSYEQKRFGDERRGVLRLVASRDGRDGSLTIHRHVDLYASVLQDGEAVTHTVGNGRQLWVHAADGTIALNGQRLGPGDGAAVVDESVVTIVATVAAEILLFDMEEPA